VVAILQRILFRLAAGGIVIPILIRIGGSLLWLLVPIRELLARSLLTLAGRGFAVLPRLLLAGLIAGLIRIGIRHLLLAHE